MAFGAACIWEAETGGSDANNGGGFDPGASVTFATDLAATVANTSAPVVTSASLVTANGTGFLARHVGGWVYIKSGTNWLPGYYKVASVAGGAATLNAAIGSAVTNYRPSTVVGCASVASPTVGTWGFDYSQQNGAGITFVDMVIDGTTNTNFTSAGFPVGPDLPGNIINVTSGTGFTVQRVEVLSQAAGVATCDKSLGTLSSTGGHGIAGGALSTPGTAGLLAVAGNWLFIQSGTYSITSATANVAGGCLSWPTATSVSQTGKIMGYNAVRGDLGTRPLLQASAISTFTLITTGAGGNHFENLSLDGASATGSKGISINTGGSALLIKAVNCKNNGLTCGGSAAAILCEVTTCSTATAMVGGNLFGCTSHDNTITGIGLNNSNGMCSDLIACNNTGAGNDGINVSSGTNWLIAHCTSYGNGRHGFGFASSVVNPVWLINCYAENHAAGWGFEPTAGVMDGLHMLNCGAFNNASGNVDTARIPPMNNLNFVTLTSTAFNNAAGNDFSLNNNATGGALLRGAGAPGAT